MQGIFRRCLLAAAVSLALGGHANAQSISSSGGLGGGSISVGSVTITTQGYTSTATITRPANTTAYAAGDVVGGAITFASAGPVAGGNLIVTSVELEIDIAAIPSGMTTFNLYLYSVTPPSALADNAPFDLPSGDRASFIGKIALGAPVDEGSTLFIRSDQVDAHLLTDSCSVYGYLVTVGGFTPAANSEVYKVKLHSVAP